MSFENLWTPVSESGYARNREQGNISKIRASNDFLDGLVRVEVDGGSG